jgi:EAL domain-containing protein (putative c-di-GMP-specific phosphodiesterase class I)
VDAASLAMVRSTIALANALGLHVIAEGIEDEATRVALRQLGCERGQGYHFSPPVPLSELLLAR